MPFSDPCPPEYDNVYDYLADMCVTVARPLVFFGIGLHLWTYEPPYAIFLGVLLYAEYVLFSFLAERKSRSVSPHPEFS